MRYNLTKRDVDIKKKYKNKKKYKIYSCQYRRKYEASRKHKGKFCSSQIALEINNNNEIINKNFILLEKHSEECINHNCINLPEVKEVTLKQKEFNEKVFKFLDNITYFDNKYIKSEILKIHKGYNFNFDNKDLNRLINNFKKNSYKFTKEYMFIQNKDKEGNFILRDYSFFLIDSGKKSKLSGEYAIWTNEFMIAHMRVSPYYFIDGTWYKPPGMVQILIIMFKEIITGLKIPGIYIVTNLKNEEMYNKIFTSVYTL